MLNIGVQAQDIVLTISSSVEQRYGAEQYTKKCVITQNGQVFHTLEPVVGGVVLVAFKFVSFEMTFGSLPSFPASSSFERPNDKLIPCEENKVNFVVFSF